ncbi:hypothetical protein VTO42DRAFT_2801 [Malbranchea cinnamomea]
MAAVRSLGLHEPSALPYLIAESVLPENPNEGDYTWRTFAAEGPDGTTSIEEEILFTDTRVIWSRGGVVKRSFAFDIEKEKVVEALFARFPTANKSTNRDVDSTTRFGESCPASACGQAEKKTSQSQPNGKKGKQVTIRKRFDVDGIPGLSTNHKEEEVQSSRALVVVLRTQVHVFFLSGDSYVVPLPFEVESVWPTPRGLLFQRKSAEENYSAIPVPSAPPNSFAPSQPIFSGQPRNSGSFRLSGASLLTLTPSPAQRSKWALKKAREASLPRIFSLVDPQSEMGLVVTEPSPLDSRSERPFEAIDPDEEILYVSSKNEFPARIHPASGKDGLVFVVTLSEKSGMYTVWTAHYRDKSSVLPQSKRRRTSSGLHSKRKSSQYDPATGTSTPVNRGPSGLRESFGGLNQSWNASTLSQAMNPTNITENSGDKTDDLAAQLGQEFGDTWKTSRRVSSLLARTDLAASYERSTFSDLAAGNQAGGRPRESLGGYSTRASFGFSQRSSLPGGNSSTFNNSISFLDAPVDKFLEGLNSAGDFEGFERMGLAETVSGLPREVILSKVASHTSGFSTTRGLPAFGKGQKFEVFTIASLYETSTNDPESIPISVCILNKVSKILTIVTLLAIQKSNDTGSQRSTLRKEKKGAFGSYYVRAADVRTISNVVDCCRIVDGDLARMLVLSSTANGKGELTIQVPWGHVVKVDLPSSLSIRQPYNVAFTGTPGRFHEAGLKRVFTTSDLRLRALGHASHNGKVTVIDDENRRHRIQLQLEPRNHLVKRALLTCRFVLKQSERAGDGVHLAWCEVMKWLRARGEDEDELEWTALVVTLFSMAVPFIEDNPSPKTPQKKRRSGGLLRWSSGSSINTDDWDTMLDQEAGSSGVTSSWMTNPAWGWISEQEQTAQEPAADRANDIFRPTGQSGTRKNKYILRCATLAREYLSSLSGVAASGTEGYLPTSVCRDHNTKRTSLGTILVGLHLIREELKLNTVTADVPNSGTGFLVPVLAQIGAWLGWESWTWKADSYYSVETSSIDNWAFEDSRITKIDVPPEPFPPPSIFAYVESSTQQKHASFLTIIDIVSPSSDSKSQRGRLWEQALNLTPITLALIGFISELGQQRAVAERTKLLLRWGLTPAVIDALPDGINASLHETVARCQIDPPSSCTASLLELVDRDDLYMSIKSEHPTPPPSWPQFVPSHDALRDTHSLGYAVFDTNQASVPPEADRQSTTSLIFNEDRRFFEAMRLLNQMKPPVAECYPEPDWSESDLLEAQKELVQLVILRTLSIPVGRAMASFRARVPLLTERLAVPSFSLQCVMKPSNVTISADRTGFTEERVSWAFFHNGAAAGLTISKHAKGIDTSWILYNKPVELTNRHAGFLLALGLNGHLKSLAKWVAFKYLTPKHTMTSIGLLLGLSASYLGTMDTLITRLLSVHVTRMLPPGAAELNLSPLTQTTGIMGIGLLYCGSQHRRMSEVMLSEIESLEEEDTSLNQESLRDEGYRLAAGFALGLINLAKGKDLRGLRDMRIVERLLALAVGTKNVDYVHILDRATAGATVALAIIFMKSNDITVAEKIDIPDTPVQFDYVRPDIFLLRTLAKHLIMWDSIEASPEWLRKNLPKIYRRRYKLTSINHLSTDDMSFFNIVAGLCFAVGLRFAGSGSSEARDLLVAYLDQFIRICRLPVVNYDGKLTRNSVRNCQDIVALSAAAVMAGTGDLVVFRRLRSLHGRIDGETPYGSYMAAHMAIGLLFLAGGTYTLGTSDLAVASLLCAFYPIFPTTVLDNKCHLQAFRHLWVLAAEPRCLIPRDIDTRRPVTVPICITLKSGQKKVATAPCLLPDLRDISSVTLQSTEYWNFTLDFARNSDELQSKFLNGDQSIYVRRRTANNAFGSSFFSSTLMALSDAQDILPSSNFSDFSRTTVLTGARPAILPRGGRLQTRSHACSVLDWIFNLSSFKHLDMAEKTLVISAATLQPRFIHTSIDGKSGGGRLALPAWLRTTAVDTRLVLEKTVRNLVAAAAGNRVGDEVVRDRLWQLRLLFAWVDWMDAERERAQERESSRGIKGKAVTDGEETTASMSMRTMTAAGLWLRREVIEDARWKIWGVQVSESQ